MSRTQIIAPCLLCLFAYTTHAEIYLVHDPEEHKIAIVERLDEEGNGRITRYNGSTATTYDAINIVFINAFNAIFIQFNGLSLNLPVIDESRFCGEGDDSYPCRMLEQLFHSDPDSPEFPDSP